jgi:hypothetical protein
MSTANRRKQQMKLEDLDDTLPNGFHDATISELTRDYENAKLRLKVDILIELAEGSPRDANRYRGAEIIFHSVMFCVIEAPDPESSFRHPGCIWFRFSRMEPGVMPEPLMKSLPPEILCYSLFILDWWSHIHVAAADVSFTWSDPQEPILVARQTA